MTVDQEQERQEQELVRLRTEQARLQQIHAQLSSGRQQQKQQQQQQQQERRKARGDDRNAQGPGDGRAATNDEDADEGDVIQHYSDNGVDDEHDTCPSADVNSDYDDDAAAFSASDRQDQEDRLQAMTATVEARLKELRTLAGLLNRVSAQISLLQSNQTRENAKQTEAKNEKQESEGEGEGEGEAKKGTAEAPSDTPSSSSSSSLSSPISTQDDVALDTSPAADVSASDESAASIEGAVTAEPSVGAHAVTGAVAGARPSPSPRSREGTSSWDPSVLSVTSAVTEELERARAVLRATLQALETAVDPLAAVMLPLGPPAKSFGESSRPSQPRSSPFTSRSSSRLSAAAAAFSPSSRPAPSSSATPRKEAQLLMARLAEAEAELKMQQERTAALVEDKALLARRIAEMSEERSTVVDSLRAAVARLAQEAEAAAEARDRAEKERAAAAAVLVATEATVSTTTSGAVASPEDKHSRQEEKEEEEEGERKEDTEKRWGVANTEAVSLSSSLCSSSGDVAGAPDSGDGSSNAMMMTPTTTTTRTAPQMAAESAPFQGTPTASVSQPPSESSKASSQSQQQRQAQQQQQLQQLHQQLQQLPKKSPIPTSLVLRLLTFFRLWSPDHDASVFSTPAAASAAAGQALQSRIEDDAPVDLLDEVVDL